MTLSFDATEPDGSPRVFAGMWRPPSYNEQSLLERIGHGPLYIYEHQRRDAWQRGDFDRPLYEVATAAEPSA